MLIVNYGDDTVTVASTADLTNQVVLPVGGAPATFGEFITAAITGVVQFSSANYSVNEPLTGTVNAAITVTRTGAPGATIVVPYATASGGTATAGTLGTGDYGQTSGFLTFTSSGPTSSSRTFNVPIFADSTAEGPETVRLVLGPPTGLADLGPPATAELKIFDISGGRIQLSAATYSVNEVGDGRSGHERRHRRDPHRQHCRRRHRELHARAISCRSRPRAAISAIPASTTSRRAAR